MENDLFIIDDQTLLDDGQMMRQMRLYDETLPEFDPLIAYLKDNYYYLYRGSLQDKAPGVDEPGIYWDNVSNKPILFEPVTAEEKEKFTFKGKIYNNAATEIIRQLNNKEVEVFVFPESSKIFCPEITENDDILKRAMKMVMLNKRIDLDRIKHRFVDKNALFNFKQVIKGDNRLSMLLFDRGAEAFNLKYTIIIEENPGETIGSKLTEPIVITSSDTYQMEGSRDTTQKDDA